MSKLEVQIIDAPSGQSTVTIGDSNASTITLKSGATLTNFPANTPALFAFLNTTQTATNNNYTKVTLNQTSIDTASGFNTSSYEYTVPEAGKYYIMATIIFTTGAANALRDHNISIRKNGSSFAHTTDNPNSAYKATGTLECSIIATLAANDVISLYGHINSTNAAQFEGSSTETNETSLYMFKLAGA
jgi:hypothetical protein